MNRKMTRREFAGAAAAALAALAGAQREAGGSLPLGHTTIEVNGGSRFDAPPGFSYTVFLESDDPVPVGASWLGGSPVGDTPAAAAEDRFPLEPLFRKRLVWKLDDLAGWCFPSWVRFIDTLDRTGAKADLGINPGVCGPEVWEWLEGLDRLRFEPWNHTWDHGINGPNQHGLPYQVQYENLDRCQRLVREKLGITMTAFGPAGIKLTPESTEYVGDADEVTYYVVRNHPELHSYFGASAFADNGPGRINSEGVLTISGPIDFENPDGLNTSPEQREYTKLHYSESFARLYPEEDPHRPPGVGNPEELAWRLARPLAAPDELERMECACIQCHPWNWDTPRGLDSVAEIARRISESGRWRLSNISETRDWLADKDTLALEKIAPGRYVLDCRRLRHSHRIEFSGPRIREVVSHPFVAEKG